MRTTLGITPLRTAGLWKGLLLVIALTGEALWPRRTMAQEVTGIMGEPHYTFVGSLDGVEVSWGVKKDLQSSTLSIAILKLTNTTNRRLEVTIAPTFTCADGTTYKDNGFEDHLPPLASHHGEMSGLWFTPCAQGVVPRTIALTGFKVVDPAAEQRAETMNQAKEASQSTARALDGLHELYESARREHGADPAYARALRNAHDDITRLDQRYARPVDASSAAAYYAQLEQDITSSRSTLESALSAASLSSRDARTKSDAGSSGARTGESSGNSGGSGAGSTTSSPAPEVPQLTHEEQEALAEMMGGLFSLPVAAADPKLFGAGKYSGEINGRWGQDQMSGRAWEQSAMQDVRGTTWSGSANKIFWMGGDARSMLWRPGLELAIGGGQTTSSWADRGYYGKASLTNAFGSGRATLWFGFLGFGYMYSEEHIDAVMDSVPQPNRTMARVAGKYTRKAYGPVVSIANNNSMGIRGKLEGYYLQATDSTIRQDQWAQGARMPVSTSRAVRGVIAEVGLGAYFLRAEQRYEQLALYSIGERFDSRLMLSAGARFAY